MALPVLFYILVPGTQGTLPGDVFVRGVRLLPDAVQRLVHGDGPQQRHLLRARGRGRGRARGHQTPVAAEIVGPRGIHVEDVGHGVVDEGLDGGLGRGTAIHERRLGGLIKQCYDSVK